jgi:hypothetical protein
MLKKKEKIVKQTSFVKFDTETKKYNSKFVRFVSLYRYTNFYQKCLVVVSIGILTGFLTLILAEESGIYYGGTGAFCQGIARFTYVILMKNMPENENINIIVFQLLY